LGEMQTKVLKVFHLVDLYFFKLAQPLTVSTVLLCKLQRRKKGGKPDRKSHPLSFDLRNLYRNLQPENSQDYARKPRNWLFMNSASVYWTRAVEHKHSTALQLYNIA
jgi:hypothetical protein